MKAMIATLQPELNTIFTHLHENPEISWEEHNTTEYIKKLFQLTKCKITTFDNSTGLIVEIGHGKPIVALRADIDALWQEVDGIFKANHSCGHDAHMTIVIGSILTLLKFGLPDTGTFKFIFQPAEEKGTGALALIEEGIMDNVDFLYGMHLRPTEELSHGKFAPAIKHGAAQFINGKIRGVDAHGARPHLNANAILIGSELFQHINNLYINPSIPHSVKMTAFHAGGKSDNIIPGNGTFSLDLRAQTNDGMAELLIKVTNIVRMLSNYHQVSIDLQVTASVGAAVISHCATSILSEAIIDSVGQDNLAPISTTTGGDDFHYYTIKRPHIKSTMLAIGCGLSPGLHHPHMTFDHEIIPKAIEILTKTLIKTAENH